MNDKKKLISDFVTDILDYMISRDRQNIFIETKIDDDGVYYLFHNDELLDECEDFQRYVFKKECEHLLKNNIRNVCFTYDFRLIEKVGNAWGIQDFMENLTFGIASKTDFPESVSKPEIREVFDLIKSPKTKFIVEIDTEIRGVAS